MGFYDEIAAVIGRGMEGSLVTVVEKTGAAPREKGAKMFVGADGAILGTVGGGSVEAFACDEALKLRGRNEPVLMPYVMAGKNVEDEGMLCGGDVMLLFEPVPARHRELYEKVSLFEKKGRKGIVMTRYRGGPYGKALLDEQGNHTGDGGNMVPAEGLDVLMGRRGPFLWGDFVVEPIEPTANLIIFGGGHVSLFLSRTAKMVHFNVTVVDDREDFANADRFPEADSIVVGGFGPVFGRLQFTEETYVVIVTRGHRYDALVLEECMKRPGRYIGMIGSSRKVAMVRDHLRGKGFSAVDLDKVYAPIGLDIHSETPEEIAVSIAAQLIQVRGEVHGGR
jgi:xanthine dehydrogenase accessory factor